MGVGEWIFISLAVLAVIALIFFASKIIVFLFSNWIVAKIISVASSVGAFIAGISCFKDHTDNSAIWPLMIFTVLAYMFAISEMVFDTHFDGWKVYQVDENVFDFIKSEAGGFFGNLAFSIAIVLVGYFLLAMMIPAFYFIIPILILVMNGIFIFMNINGIF